MLLYKPATQDNSLVQISTKKKKKKKKISSDICQEKKKYLYINIYKLKLGENSVLETLELSKVCHIAMLSSVLLPRGLFSLTIFNQNTQYYNYYGY